MKSLLVFNCFLLISSAYSFRIGPKADCAISVNNDLTEPQPLILIPNAPAGEEWAYPGTGDVIAIAQDSAILLACPGGDVLVGGTSIGADRIEGTCVGGLTFNLGAEGDVSFSSVTCSRYPFHDARRTGQTCDGDKDEVEIGFDLGTMFLRTITICFDPVAQNSLWSLFTMTKSIGGYQSGFPRPGFIEGDFYDVGGSVDTLYSTATQRVTINNLVGLPASSTKYVGSGDFFMSRGHLTAKADFVFGTQHRSTFWFVNVAPQWQTFNGGNWNNLEMSVRDFEAGRPNDVLVYTGTYGILTFPHEETGEDIPLYLYVSGDLRGIPVPEVYWRVIYDPVTKGGIAFVGQNNPYADTYTKYCTDICDQINWVNWSPTNQQLGFGYCCDVNELRQTIATIPALEINSILTS